MASESTDKKRWDFIEAQTKAIEGWTPREKAEIHPESTDRIAQTENAERGTEAAELTYEYLLDFHNKIQTNLGIIPLMDQLFKFIEATASGDGPTMTNIMIDFGEGDNKTLLKLWASASMNSPMDRIATLRERTDSLESQLQAANAKIEDVRKIATDAIGLLENTYTGSPSMDSGLQSITRHLRKRLYELEDQSQPASLDSRDSIALTGQENDT